MPVQGVFFDLYGTLLLYGDMQAAWTDWLTTFYAGLRRHGLALSLAAFAGRCDRFFGKAEPPARADGLTVLERRIATLCEELQLAVPSEDLAGIANRMVGAWQHHVTLDPECRPVLQALQPQHTLGVITNFDQPAHVYQVLADLGLVAFFKVIVVSGEVGVKKPAPQIFHRALAGTGLQPEAVVYVGDTADDVTGAWAAAIRPIVIQRAVAEGERQALDFRVAPAPQQIAPQPAIPAAVRVIARLSDLLPLLEQGV